HYFRDLLPEFTRIKDTIQRIRVLNQENMVTSDRAARALAQRSERTAIGVGAGAVVFAVWFALGLPSIIVRPLEGLTRTAQAVGEGDLSAAAVDPGFAELEPLADSFNKMLERLRAYRESSLGELLAAKDLARATLECLLDPVVVFDLDGGVRFANEAAEEAFGLRIGSAEELRTADVHVPGEIEDARVRVLATGAMVLPRSLSEAMRWRARKGEERHYLVRAAPLTAAPSEEKPGASVIIVAQDVTRFRRI